MKKILRTASQCNKRLYNTKVDIGSDYFSPYKHIISVMSPIIEISGIKNTICSIYFYPESFSRIDLNLLSVKLYRTGFQKIIIFWVTKADISTNYVDYINDNDENSCIIGIYSINIKILFEDENFKSKFLDNNSTSNNHHNIYFIFDNINLPEISIMWKSNGVILNGGSISKRYILSPVHHRLSQFISAIEGPSLNGIVNSFYIKDKKIKLFNNYDVSLTRLNFDFGNKKSEERFLEKISSNKLKTKNEELSNAKESDDSKIKEKEYETSSGYDSVATAPLSPFPLNIIGIANSGQDLNFKKFSIINKRLIHTIASSESIINRELNNEPAKLVNENIFSFLDFIGNELNSMNLNQLSSYEKQIKITALQKKIETGWIESIKNKLLEPENGKFMLNLYIFKVFESWSLFLQQEKTMLKNINNIHDENIIAELNNIEIIMLSLSVIITYYNKYGYTNISNIIGNLCFKNIYKKLLKKDLILESLTYQDFSKIHDLSEFKKIKLGLWILNIFEQRSVILKILNYKDISEIKINEECFKEIINNLVLLPSSLPMISKPLLWGNNKFGGFLSNEQNKTDLIEGSSIKHNHKVENRINLYSAVNYLNSIQFNINFDLLDYIKNEGNYLLIENKPDINNKEELNSYNSIKLERSIILKIADIYKNIPFYISTHADWRGRLYTSSFWINYQGSDLSNALINYYEGEVLNEKGLEYLYIYGANAFNENKISKLPYSQRIEWVLRNKDKIISMESSFMLKAEEKFVFAAFCLVMRKLNDNPNYKVHLPVFLDATCSGIQHLAALIKDYELATTVNLVPQSNLDKVGDIYSAMVNPINEAINQFGLDNSADKELIEVKLSRKDIKHPIMTTNYNVTKYGISEQLQEVFVKGDPLIIQKGLKNIKIERFKVPNKNDEFILLNKLQIYKIASIINSQLFLQYPALKYIYDYFIGVTKLLLFLELPINWVTPSGLNITQDYLKTKKYKVSVSLSGKSKTLILKKVLKDKKDLLKQSSAIIPNIIHSLDASHLINIINICSENNIKNLITIHDCFGTHPNNMENLNIIIRKEFIKMYLNVNFLEQFHKNLIQLIIDNNFKLKEISQLNENEKINIIGNKNTLDKLLVDPKALVVEYFDKEKRNHLINIMIPKQPKSGNLDLEGIIHSKYFIA